MEVAANEQKTIRRTFTDVYGDKIMVETTLEKGMGQHDILIVVKSDLLVVKVTLSSYSLWVDML